VLEIRSRRSFTKTYRSESSMPRSEGCAAERASFFAGSTASTERAPKPRRRRADAPRRRRDRFAGGPQSGDSFAMSDYAPAFRHAADLGIGRTVHAAKGVRRARSRCHRIAPRVADGHGTTSWRTRASSISSREERDDRSVPDEQPPNRPSLLARIPCRAGSRCVRACVCPDNTLFSRRDVEERAPRRRRDSGMTTRLDQAIAFGPRARFHAKLNGFIATSASKTFGKHGSAAERALHRRSVAPGVRDDVTAYS